MGCNMCKEGGKANEVVNERSHLIRNEVGGVSSSRPIHEDGTRSISSITRTDEQSLLSRIVHKTADEIIDVSAIEPHSMERSEFMEKMRLYQDKASVTNVKIQKHKSSLPNTSTPVNVLLGEPINAADVKLIVASTNSAANAIQQMEINVKEPLIVPFGVNSDITA